MNDHNRAFLKAVIEGFNDIRDALVHLRINRDYGFTSEEIEAFLKSEYPEYCI